MNRKQITDAATTLVRTADATCAALTGGHAKAVCGKPFVVHLHSWDSTARGGDGGRAVSVRVLGQYLDRSRTVCANTVEAQQVAAEAGKIIGHDEIDEAWGEL
jgi:hypothetical protein